MRKIEKGDNLVMDLQNLTKSKSCHLHLRHNLLHWIMISKTKREIIQSWIYRILPKVNQAIYTLDTICDSNILTLAKEALEVFCSQASDG